MLTFFCISTFFKGNEFLKSAKIAGNRVFLLTEKKLEAKPWAREFIDEIFFIDTPIGSNLNMEDLVKGLAFKMRTIKIDRIVALDDFDVEKAAFLREHFRIPGMGQTTARYFRDKLAMRAKAKDANLNCPAFSSLFNNDEINHFADHHVYPFMVKPRSEASATGIKKVWNKDELWQAIDALGEERHDYLIEQFKPGEVYHVDSLTVEGEVIFTQVSQYLSTPFEVAHGGGVFRSVTVEYQSEDALQLEKFNKDLLKAFGLNYSASHTEFIKCREDGKFYFLETASRVGGANLAEMVEAATSINLWREWAIIETAMAKNEKYTLPEVKNQYAGIVISLARQQWPNMDQFQEKEIYWKMNEEYHIGMIVQSEDRNRVLALLDQYSTIIQNEYHASAPSPDKSVH
jgi:hypothetical protein